MLNTNWEKPKLRHRSPNLVKMIDHFNDVVLWVASLVVKATNANDRKKRIRKLIRIADVSFLKILFTFPFLVSERNE